jgi:hypothetical protein
MASYIRQKPPGWFVAIAVLLVLWGLAGCASFYVHIAYGPDIDPKATDWDRAFFAALPGWLNIVYAIAVGGGLLGSIALLMRSKLATLLYILSLIAVIIQFGYIFAATDLIAHKGAASTVPFPLLIAAIAIFQIWFAKRAERRGWIS